MPATSKQRAMVVGKLSELEGVKPGKQEVVFERLKDMAMGGDGGKLRPEHDADARSLHYSNWDDIDFDIVLEELQWGDRKEAKERNKRIRRTLSRMPIGEHRQEIESKFKQISEKKQQ